MKWPWSTWIRITPLLLLLGSGAVASPDQPALALKGATVYPASGPKIENGVVLIEKGKISAVGPGIPIPAGAQIIDVSGKIMGGEETTMFHGRIHEYITQNKKKIVVDLAKVEWMNSVGLGMLISALTTVKNAGGRLVLANITTIESVLTITRLINVFEHFDSRKEAIEALRK